ncbi:hypothetical protein Mettu_2237 [Methylobacter tundripaludum SV96]|uniref:Uncharacterized protein n=1 Tax=Methylobacter tundripaludum (strain ATCC BAA-1195 / DSM 17260 / SV96) TaxID=697282 RepID=G3IXH8_METTV|nr:hypothetical protein Mettu_2237 [Methylobacter tundripaludum SV96]
MNSANYTCSRSHELRGNAVKARCAANHDQRLALRDAARPALHSHAARGNEDKIRQKALFDSLIPVFSLREKGLSILNLMADVGRNKAIQAHSARWRFRRIWMMFAGNASSRYRSNRLIPAYFCVTRVPKLQLPVLNSQAGAWELAQTGVQALLALAGEACTPAFVRVPTGNLPLVPTSRLGIFSLLSFPRGGDLTAATQRMGTRQI